MIFRNNYRLSAKPAVFFYICLKQYSLFVPETITKSVCPFDISHHITSAIFKMAEGDNIHELNYKSSSSLLLLVQKNGESFDQNDSNRKMLKQKYKIFVANLECFSKYLEKCLWYLACFWEFPWNIFRGLNMVFVKRPTNYHRCLLTGDQLYCNH